MNNYQQPDVWTDNNNNPEDFNEQSQKRCLNQNNAQDGTTQMYELDLNILDNVWEKKIESYFSSGGYQSSAFKLIAVIVVIFPLFQLAVLFALSFGFLILVFGGLFVIYQYSQSVYQQEEKYIEEDQSEESSERLTQQTDDQYDNKYGESEWSIN